MLMVRFLKRKKTSRLENAGSSGKSFGFKKVALPVIEIKPHKSAFYRKRNVFSFIKLPRFALLKFRNIFLGLVLRTG
jgi:hypothetical protein